MECDSLVWQVSCVSTTVPVQFAPVTETLFAHGTGKGSLPRMPSEMSHVTFMPHEPLTQMIIFHFSISPLAFVDCFVSKRALQIISLRFDDF